MPKTDSKNMLVKLLPGCAVGAAVTVVLAMLLLTLPSWLIASGRVGEGAGMTMTAAVAFIAACAGALTARIKNGSAALLSGLLTGALAAAVRLLIMFISDTPSSFDSGDLWVIAAILAGGTVTGLVKSRKKRRRR